MISITSSTGLTTSPSLLQDDIVWKRFFLKKKKTENSMNCKLGELYYGMINNIRLFDADATRRRKNLKSSRLAKDHESEGRSKIGR